MKIRLSRRADSDLTTAIDYLVQENPAAAQEFADVLELAFRNLERYPRIGHPTDFRGVYVYTLRKFPYRIFYRIVEDTISVETIFHTSRRPDEQ